MNKFLLLLGFLYSFSYGQTLVVTPEGLRNTEELEKTFVVINVEGKTAKELYDASVKYIHKTYQDPDHVIKGNIENDFLSFSTHQPNFMTIKVSFLKLDYTIDYTCALSFKEGKVKFEITSIEMYEKGKFPLLFKGQGALSAYYIYNPKNELKRQDAKDQIENYFNTQIALYKQQITENLANEKW